MITNTQQNQSPATNVSDLLTGSSASVVSGQSGSAGVQGAEKNSGPAPRTEKKSNETSRNSNADFSKHLESDSSSKTQSSKSTNTNETRSTDKSPRTAESTGKAKGKREGERGGTVAHQVLKQLVKQNPGSKPPALVFLESQPHPAPTDDLPQLMASSRLIADALLERDLNGYLDESVKPSQVMMELGFGPEMIVQAMAMGVDGSGALQRGQILGAMGADPKNIETGLGQLKDSILAGGLTGYMQQSLAITNASGRSPDLIAGMSGLMSGDMTGSAEAWATDSAGEIPADIFSDGSSTWFNVGIPGDSDPRLTQHAEMHAFLGSSIGPSIGPSMGAFMEPSMDPSMGAMNGTNGQNGAPLQTGRSLPDSSLNISAESISGGSISAGITAHAEKIAAIGSVVSDGRIGVPGSDVTTISPEDLDGIGFENVIDAGKAFAAVQKVGSLDLTKFKSALQADFGDNAKVIAIGPDAWKVADDLFVNETTVFVGEMTATQDGSQGAYLPQLDISASFDSTESGLPERDRASEGFFNLSTVLSDRRGTDFRSDQDSRRDELSEQSRNFENGMDLRVSREESSRPVAFPGVLPSDIGVTEADTLPEVSGREKIETSARHAIEVVRKIQDAVRHTSVSNIGAMRLDLSSADTGPLEVLVRMDSDQQVDVRLIANSEELRELIARELPQLRDALSEQNVTLREFQSRTADDSTGQMFGQGRNSGENDLAGRQGGGSGSDENNKYTGSRADQLNQQMGRQALRSFRVLDLTNRGIAGAGRIKVLA